MTNLEPNQLAAVGDAIIKRLSTILNHKVSITDPIGNIVADTDLENFDKFVPTALVSIQEKKVTNLPSGEIDDLSGWIIPLSHEDKVLGTVSIRNSPTPEEDNAAVAKSLAELILYQTLIIERVSQESRVLDKFFYDLLENEKPAEKLMQDAMFFNSQFFQIDFSEYDFILTLTLENFWQDVLGGQTILPSDEHKLTSIKDKLGELIGEISEKNPVIAYLGENDFIALIKPKQNIQQADIREKIFNSLSEKISTEFERKAFIGLSTKAENVANVSKRYQEAKKAVKLGIRINNEKRIFYFPDLILPIIVQESDKALQRQFVKHELGELIEDEDLVNTLSTHYDCNLNLKQTAYQLGIHKNTLYYRLDKIKKLIKVDPQEFNQAIKLKLALYLWQILKEDH